MKQDYQLAMLISQAGGPMPIRALVKEQMRDWHDRRADQHINKKR